MILQGHYFPLKERAEQTYLNDLKSIYVLDHQKNKLQPIYVMNGDTIINSVSADQKGTFWIGTNYGLSSYTPEYTQVQKYIYRVVWRSTISHLRP